MKCALISVNDSNLQMLYDLNRQMAISEGQESLFTADYKVYSEAFRDKSLLVYSEFIYCDNDLAGFLIWQKKFATYSAGRVLYIEDLYMDKYADNDDALELVLDAIADLSLQHNCSRIEIRRLEHSSFSKDAISRKGYLPINKWKIWRKDIE